MTGRHVFVLSGGGSRGAAQIGMLRALLGAGIVPEALVGASVGAINACFLGSETTPARVEALADRWMTMTERHLIGHRRAALANLARRRPYLFSADALRGLVSCWLDVDRLEDLTVPVRIATTHLASGAAVHHDTGSLLDLICASAALPAVFPPVALDTGDGPTAHVDAGIAENVPLSGALALARPGDTVWVLDVTKRGTPRALRNPLDVLVAALAATVANQRSDVAFEPGVEVVRIKIDEAFDCGPVFDFTHTGTLFRLGEQAAVETIAARPALA